MCERLPCFCVDDFYRGDLKVEEGAYGEIVRTEGEISACKQYLGAPEHHAGQ